MSKLICTSGMNHGDEFPLMLGINVIGRNDKGCQVNLFDKKVSHKHCQILRDGKNYVLEDVGSRNGTFLNGKPIARKTSIKAGDVIIVGETKLLVSDKPIGDLIQQTATDVAAELQEKRFGKLMESAAAGVQQKGKTAPAQDTRTTFIKKISGMFGGKG